MSQGTIEKFAEDEAEHHGSADAHGNATAHHK